MFHIRIGMRKYLLLFIILSVCYGASAQKYGNEWIRSYDKQFWRIFVYEDGIFRIDSATLAAAGVPMNTDPKKFQVFGRGKQQYIYVQGENDGEMNSGDYIEFYGMHNDGWYDTTLYANHADQPNPNYSMFNDTAIYYLTISNAVNDTAYRMTIETDVGSYTALPYFNKVSRIDYTDYYSTGNTDYNDVTDPEYVASEGWFDAWFGRGSSTTKNIPTPNAYSTGFANYEFLIVGCSNYGGLWPDHHLQIKLNSTLIKDTTFEGYYTYRYSDSVAIASISTSPTSFTFQSVDDLGSSGNNDYNAVSYVNVKYPHTLDLEGSSTFLMYVPFKTGAPAPTKVKLSFSNFAVSGGDPVRFYDITNHKRIEVTQNGANYDVVLPNGVGEKKCYIISDGQAKNISSIFPVNYDISRFAKFTDFTTSDVLGSDYIIVSHQSLWAQAEAYRDYRNTTQSPDGTLYKALLVDVNELYDQFSYGIRKNPMSIRNFIYYAYDNFYSTPKDVFLLGKGYRCAIVSSATPNNCYRKNTGYYSATLIPGFGVPASDILFSKRDTLFKPIVPIGRLAARTPDQATWYLNKVMQYEDAQRQANLGTDPEQWVWMKNVLHFGGGQNQGEADGIHNALDRLKLIIEDTLFGGYVRTFVKTSTAPIQINTADSLRDLINNGVSLMTFFGHGAGIGFDYSIDYPENYDNYEKYPFLLALSCLAGDLFNEVPTSSEEFVLIENKGVIGYLASVTKADATWLEKYATQLYRNFGYINYGNTVGVCIQNTIDSVDRTYPGMFSAKSVCLEMTLHGDPAIKMNSFELPDYEVSEPDVYFTPSEVTTLDSVFTVNIISTNLGRAIDTVFKVNLLRVYPDGTDTTINFQVDATLYKDTFQVNLPVDLSKDVGLNSFTVWLDNYNDIPEISENNNYTTVSLNIKSNNITPVYPYEYAIVPTLANLTLKASTGDPFAAVKSYRFELDTTDAFNSPVKVSQVISHAGGVVPWNPVFPITSDSIVYFWRCSPDSAIYGSYSWRGSSFQYITGKRGWGQAHFFQFNKDDYQYVKYNKPARRFQFVNDLKSIFAQTGYYNGSYDWLEERFSINGYMPPGSLWTCLTNGVKVVVFDSISGELWSVPGLGYPYFPADSAWHCQDYTTYVRDFVLNADDYVQNRLTNFLNSVPQNNYVLVMSHGNHFCQEWNNNLVHAFRSIGSTVDTNYRFDDGRPYLIFGKKGATPGSVTQQIGNPIGVYPYLIQLYDTMQTRWTEGHIQSVTIGPAASWDSLFWRVESIDPYISDKVTLSVIGIKTDGTTQTLINDLAPIPANEDMSIRDLIDNSLYPYIKLIAVMEDDSFSTPYQMLRWQVTYEPMPETALDPSLYFTFVSDTVDEGDSVHFACATHNISEYNMDSLLIHFWVIDANREIALEKYIRYEPHPAGDTLIGSYSFPTMGLAGLNELWVEVNPNNDQLEQYHFNNIGSLTFLTNADKINPLLDVTFDGVHIMDGDIVSAKPLIEIRLKDENKFLLLNDMTDTALFKVFITSPDESAAQVFFTELPSEEGKMYFYPASSSSDNKCRIEYNADFPMDGTYKLKVQAMDKSRNTSGNYDYEVEFEVINKSTITQVMNWPNPFSTATHFVFTLTGYELPSYFKIQIMTITGKVVREINMDELGNLHIGRNITTYAWDGKDEYGDQLANGVYLYRVITHINGKIIEKSQTEADKYFKEEFGKMYLMR
jgi:hypothetical protein